MREKVRPVDEVEGEEQCRKDYLGKLFHSRNLFLPLLLVEVKNQSELAKFKKDKEDADWNKNGFSLTTVSNKK